MKPSSGLFAMMPISDALAVKENFTLESVVLTLRSLDGRDKTTKVTLNCRNLYTLHVCYVPYIGEEARGSYYITAVSCFWGSPGTQTSGLLNCCFSSFLYLKGYEERLRHRALCFSRFRLLSTPSLYHGYHCIN